MSGRVRLFISLEALAHASSRTSSRSKSRSTLSSSRRPSIPRRSTSSARRQSTSFLCPSLANWTRYLQLFTTVEPTTHAVCQYHSDKSSENIREMRPDTLAQIMALANVRPGGRTLIVEDVHGLVVGAALERMGGEYSPLLRTVLTERQGREGCSLSTTPIRRPTF